MKLGRFRPTRPHRLRLTPHLRTLELPDLPPSCDYSTAALDVLSDVLCNDELGCCVVSGIYHVLGMLTANAGAEFHATPEQIVADYSAIGGYNPADPNTDQGLDESTALSYWTTTGLADGTRLTGWVALDATNGDEIRAACYLFENLYLGIELPSSYVSPFPSSNGYDWADGAPVPSNGHCVMGTGYNALGVQIDSWGLLGTLEWAAIADLCLPANGGAIYAIVTPDQLAKGQDKAPNGVAWDALVAEFELLGGIGG